MTPKEIQKYLIPHVARLEISGQTRTSWPQNCTWEWRTPPSPADTFALKDFFDLAHTRYGGAFAAASSPGGFLRLAVNAQAGLGPEAYMLAVDQGVELVGGSSAGLFYGLQTLLQLWAPAKKFKGLPQLRIQDAPALAWRMYQYDLAREQSVQLDFLKSVIRSLAHLKVNKFMLYLEGRFAWTKHPELVQDGVLTRYQARELVDFARQYHIEVMPCVNTLGHAEHFLAHPNYAHLREAPGVPYDLCPSHPESFPLITGLLDEAMAAFESPYFHAGGDECNLGRCPRCAPRAQAEGRAGIYADWYTQLRQFAAQRGKTLMLWGDIGLQHREILDRLPKDIMIFDWHYHGPSPDTLQLYRDHGFQVISSPSINGWCSPIIAYTDGPDKYLRPMVEEAVRLNLPGACITTWEYQGGNLFVNNWPHHWFAAASMWRPDENFQADFLKRCAGVMLGAEKAPVARLVEILGRELPALLKPQYAQSKVMARHVLFRPSDPFTAWQLGGPIPSKDQLTEVKKLTQEAREAQNAILHEAEFNVEMFAGYVLPIEYGCMLLDRILAVQQACRHYQQARQAAAKGDFPSAEHNLAKALKPFSIMSHDLVILGLLQAEAVVRYGASREDWRLLQNQLQRVDRRFRLLWREGQAFCASQRRDWPELASYGWFQDGPGAFNGTIELPPVETLRAGERRTITAHLTNLGPADWHPYKGVKIASPLGESAIRVLDIFSLPMTVCAGASADYAVSLQAPSVPGQAELRLQFLRGEDEWFGQDCRQVVKVTE